MKAILSRVLLAGQAIQSNLIAKFLGPNAVAIIAQSGNGLFAVDPRDRGVGRQLLKYGSYGEEELKRLISHVPRTGRVLVVGAHVGALAIPLARQCSELIAVEANPLTNRLLRFNMRLNEITNCTVLDVAASDTSGHIDMLLNTANSGGAKRVPLRTHSAYVYDNPVTVTVPCARLDDSISNHRFDLIVMDIEGSEYFALKGMSNLLRDSAALAVEFLPHHLRNVSAVGVSQFLTPIERNFSRLEIPSKAINISREQFMPTLQSMFDAGEGDDGIVFTK